MDVFFLGAGRPAHGQKPSALKQIAKKTKVMDWQVHIFEETSSDLYIHFIGGYQIEDIIQSYPQFDYSVVPDWQDNGISHTLLKAPFRENHSTFISYTDTIFRSQVAKDMMQVSGDIIFAYDSQWQSRYDSRAPEDIRIAETIDLSNFSGSSSDVAEFTGLIFVKAEAIKYFTALNDEIEGKSLPEVLLFLKNCGADVQGYDVASQWAELNAPEDIARFILGTKAATLARLQPLVKFSHIGMQICLKKSAWNENSEKAINTIQSTFPNTRLVIRSSAQSEDGWEISNAGGYESYLNIPSNDVTELNTAVENVFASYGEKTIDTDEVLIQEFVDKVRMSGVIFTCGLETGAPYYRINFDDQTASTDSVTSGTSGDLRTVIVSRQKSDYLEAVEPALVPVLQAVKEIEELLGFDKLDIEFAVDENHHVHIFQIRPITVDHSDFEHSEEAISLSLESNV